MNAAQIAFAALVAAVTSITALAIFVERRKAKIIAAAPKCVDCRHSRYLSSRRDRFEWGITSSFDDGYYCALTEHRFSSGGAAVTGFDKKRLRKCEDWRNLDCGARGRLFEPDEEARDE